ncbi:unnamed protein product [Trypanosoma congolense IL3000]|uniref:WGS project CAEQ00000000 data, annotated contig 171 n=1 Tax=Trypanosoma congolense (strain IL3000) TaxID=1068625 RepID=F9W872_TRYCI|nr:unnamed protein product [Trypanosoma congolense IL3000]
MVVILSFICEWSNYMCERREMLDGSARCRNGDDPAVARCKEGVVKMLSTLCVRRSVDLSTNAGIGVMGKVYKGAVRCLIALMRMPELQDLNVLRELVKKLCEHVNKAKSEASCNLVCWLKALTALAKDRTTARMESTLLMKSVTAILITAQSNAEVADEAHMKTKASELPSMTTAGAVVDAAAKCLTAIAMSSPSEDMGKATDATLNTLLNTCDQVEKSDQHTVGACLRRCSIKQQLLRLVIRPPPNIGSEVAVAVALSTETETVVRRVIQSKMTFNILNRKCDVRYVAYLILTAVAEDSRSGYLHLRNLLFRTGTYLRTKQEAPGVTLSSPTAWDCFIEYSIPFLVLFMAHHPYYDVEKTHFTSFQRVWHLLFDELFRYGVHCASFVTEMLNRIKQTDDPLNSESNAMRTMCDLGIRVMQECMGQRQISTDALRRYPGAVSLPSFFVGSSSTQEALDKVYLDPSVLISAKVPFRPPVTPGGGTMPGGAPSAPNVAGGEEDEEDAMESDE